MYEPTAAYMKPEKSGTAPTWSGVAPRAHVGLEELHDRADYVEQDDDAQLAERLQTARDHTDLDEHGDDREGVVAGEGGVIGVPEPHCDDRHEQQRAEEAGPRLFGAEDEELDEPAPRAARRCTIEQPVGGVVDPLLDGGEPGHGRLSGGLDF